MAKEQTEQDYSYQSLYLELDRVVPSRDHAIPARTIAAVSGAYPTRDLPARYGLSATTVYSIRMDMLQIKPFSQKGNSYITAEELQDLDALHEYIQNGGFIDEFPKNLANCR